MPFGIIYLIDYDDKLHPSAMVLTTVLAHTNSCVNAIYFAYFSTSFKHGYLEFLHRFFPCFFTKQIRIKDSKS